MNIEKKKKSLIDIKKQSNQLDIVLKVVVIVAISELLIMFLFTLPIFEHVNKYIFPMLDTLLLTLFTSPIIYTRIIKPYVIEIDKRDKLLEIERLNKSYFESIGAIENLTAGLVHEIGNPVAVISGMIDEIEYEYPKLPNKVISNLQSIKHYNHKLLLINNDLSKIATPTSKELQLIDFNEDVINKVVKVLHYDERWYGIDLKIELSPQLPAFYASSGQLKLLLSNLLSNSIEARSNNKMSVQISTKLINEEIVLSVKDNGKGMEEDIAKQAFNVFYTTKDPSNHLGFGLYCCLNIVEKNNARIKIESQPNIGTEVKIYFPI